jgi:hypothetical protein
MFKMVVGYTNIISVSTAGRPKGMMDIQPIEAGYNKSIFPINIKSSKKVLLFTPLGAKIGNIIICALEPLNL